MFFNTCTTLDELKRTYRDLAKQHHPDHGGNLETMQAINAAYTDAVKQFSRYGKMNREEKRQTANAAHTAEHVQRAIDAVKHLPGVKVELVGLWVWVSGNTYPYRVELKAAGYKFASKKKMWYFAGIEARGHGRPMDEIRFKYGSMDVTDDTQYIGA